MLSAEKQEKLSSIPLASKKQMILEMLKLRQGLIDKDLFFLSLIKSQIPFLNSIENKQLESIGKAILENLKVIKTYTGLSNIILAVYGDDTKIEYNILEAGRLLVKIYGIQAETEYTLSLYDGSDLVFSDGDKLLLTGSAEISNTDYTTFLKQFLLAGIDLEVQIKEKRDYRGYIVNQNNTRITDQNNKPITFLYKKYLEEETKIWKK